MTSVHLPACNSFLIVNLILRKHGQGEAGGRANGRAGMRGQKDQGEEVRGELGGKGQTKRFVLVLFIWCAAANNALHLSDALPGSGVTTHEGKDTIRIQPNQIGVRQFKVCALCVQSERCRHHVTTDTN